MTNSAPPPPSEYQPIQPMSPSDEKLWATLVHVAGIFFSFLPSLIGYLVLKDRGPFVRAHTMTALNFQLSVLIYSVALSVLSVVITVITFGIGTIIVVPVALAFAAGIIALCIMAAVKANKGEYYTYPLTIQFLR